MIVDGLFRLGLICVVFGAFTGCGSDDDETSSSASASQLCKDAANAICERFYECLSEAELAAAGLPASSAACKSQQQEAAGCDVATESDACDGSEMYHPNEAKSCVSQVKAASCAQLRDNSDYAPACERVCSVE
jgi:hypothetical protein